MKSFTKFPGIGPKSAERIVLHLLKQDRAQVEELARLISESKANTFFCERCNNLSEKKMCHICDDSNRDHTILCIVEEPKDVASLERTGSFNGVYHVLLGALSPLEASTDSRTRGSNSPMYALCFAAGNVKGGKIALKIASHLARTR